MRETRGCWLLPLESLLQTSPSRSRWCQGYPILLKVHIQLKSIFTQLPGNQYLCTQSSTISQVNRCRVKWPTTEANGSHKLWQATCVNLSLQQVYSVDLERYIIPWLLQNSNVVISRRWYVHTTVKKGIPCSSRRLHLMWMLNTTTQVSEGMKPWKIEVSMQFFNTTKSTHKLISQNTQQFHREYADMSGKNVRVSERNVSLVEEATSQSCWRTGLWVLKNSKVWGMGQMNEHATVWECFVLWRSNAKSRLRNG